MNDLQQIKELLELANNCDQEARSLRKQAGELLARRYYQDPQSNCWFLDVGLDRTTAEYLMRIGLNHYVYSATG